MTSSISTMAVSERLTAQLRERLRAKRIDLGLTYVQLASFFDVHWTTVRKWEAGSIARCHPVHGDLLRRFLGGECDHLFSLPEHLLTRQTLAHRQAEQQSRGCIMKLSSCCRMLRNRPELVARLIDDVTTAVNRMLSRYGKFQSGGAIPR